MTSYEHAMLGVTLALAAGARRRHGWPAVAMAGAAAALPDWDVLSLAFGGSAYAQTHRVWGHNLLAATLAGVLAGGLGYLCHLSTRVRRAAHALLTRLDPKAAPPPGQRPPFSGHALAVWLTLGTLAALSHLPVDMVYAGMPGMMSWPIALLWPFDRTGWAWPIVPWGDLGTTLIFIAEMFALYRWPARDRALAWLTLLAVAGYVGARWLSGGVAA